MQILWVFDDPALTLNEREYDTVAVLPARTFVFLWVLFGGSAPSTVTFDVNVTGVLFGLFTFSVAVAAFTFVVTLYDTSVTFSMLGPGTVTLLQGIIILSLSSAD